MPITHDTRQQLRKDFHCHIDIEVETNSTIALMSELLAVGREVRPRASYFLGNERVMSISCRPYEDENDMHKAIMEMFYMIPSFKPSATFFVQHSEIMTEEHGKMDALITTTLTPTGALHEGYPYTVEDGEVVFLQSYTLVDGTGLFSKIIEHMLPVLSTVNRFPFYSTEILEWIASRGHEVEFFGKWNPANIDV